MHITQQKEGTKEGRKAAMRLRIACLTTLTLTEAAATSPITASLPPSSSKLPLLPLPLPGHRRTGLAEKARGENRISFLRSFSPLSCVISRVHIQSHLSKGGPKEAEAGACREVSWNWNKCIQVGRPPWKLSGYEIE